MPYHPLVPPNQLHRRASQRHAVIEWIAPFDNGSSVITNHNIYRSTAEIGTDSLIASPVGQTLRR
jgi:hypothetical protein